MKSLVRRALCSISTIVVAYSLGMSINPVFAHEFWIETSNHSPSTGEVVSLSTHVGQTFAGDEVPNIKEFYSDYSVITPSGRSPVLGSLASDPPAYIEIKENGTYIVGQRTLRSWVELPPDEFIEYLNKQGMEFIVPQVAQNRSESNPIREAYSRCVKSIIQTKLDGPSAHLSKALGYTLEIIPLSNPRNTIKNEMFEVQVLYEGNPLENAKIQGLNKMYADAPITTRTDARGIAKLELPYAGLWMFHTVHMIASTESDWESFWANLTFEIGS